MSTSRALNTTKKSSWKDPVVTGASLALKIAKEATSDIPVVKQILGVAVNIVELAEKAEKNRAAMHTLAEKAATLAQLVKRVVSNRTVDGQLGPLLERLTIILDKVEAFMLKETTKGSVMTKMYRSVFVLQKKTADLSNELEAEIRGFTIATLVDTRLYMGETAQDDGQFRRLREYEVRKLAVISERETEHGAVSYAQARVDGVSELMVVKYLKRTVQPSQTSDVWTTSTEDIMTRISSLEMSHPNIAQFYGRGVQNGKTEFIVLRTGAYQVNEYLAACDNGAERFQESWRIRTYVLAASAHLDALGITWLPQSLRAILMDDHGQPYIGIFDDLVSSERCARRDQAGRVLWLITELHQLATLTQEQCEGVAHPESCDNGLLKACIKGITTHAPILRQIWARICADELYIEITTQEEPFADFSQVPPVTRSEANRYTNDLFSRRYPRIQQKQISVTTPPQNNDELNDGRVEEVSRELDVECRLLYDLHTWKGHRILYGFQGTISYRTERGVTSHFYAFDLPQEVAADVCMILNDGDDPMEALNLFSHCELFTGAVRVPLDLM